MIIKVRCQPKPDGKYDQGQGTEPHEILTEVHKDQQQPAITV
jgi:hypothetical protein